MINILNRLAWGVSLGLGLILVNGILGDSWFDDGFIYFVALAIVVIVIKKIFFSITYIENALDGKFDHLVKPVPQNNIAPREALTKENLVSREPEIKNKTISSLVDIAEKIVVSPALDHSNKKEEVEEIFKDFEVEKVAPKPRQVQEEKQERIVVPSGPNIFQVFFKENALAKVGGILLFLAVLFLMQLVYTRIGPIGKLMLGFIFGFLVFGVGLFLEHKKLHKEARVLMGISILINYLVILSGRYLIGEGLLVKQLLLNESVTFFLLIINTVFAVSVAMAYQSRVILFFSFFAAYLNPFLINEKMTLTVYTIVAYSLLVSLGAIFLSSYYKKINTQMSDAFLAIAFIGGNILAVAAPFDSTWEWLLKLGLLATLSLICFYYAYNNKNNQAIIGILSGSYIFFIILITGDKISSVGINNLSGTLGILIFFLLVALGSVFSFVRLAVSSLAYLLFVPMLFILLLFQIDVFDISSFVYILFGSLIFYLLTFLSVVDKLSRTISQLYFLALALFIFLMTVTWNFSKVFESSQFSLLESYSIGVCVFLFLFSAYFFSKREGLQKLYSISTLASVFILPMIIERSGDFRIASLFLAGLLVVSNITWPLINKQLLKDTSNLIFGALAGSLFAVYQIFYFWNGSNGMSKVSLGLSFMLLAIVYFVFSYLAFIVIQKNSQEVVAEENKKLISDTVYPLLGISISIFSLAIAYVFSTHSEIVSVILLFESSILLYFYSKNKNEKIYFASVLLMLLGALKLTMIVDVVKAREYVMLIPLLIVLATLALNLKFLEFEKRNLRIVHDLLHIATIFIIGAILTILIPDHSLGWLIFGFSIYALVLSIIYSAFFSGIVKWFYVGTLGYILLIHIIGLESSFFILERNNLELYKIFQYFSSIMFIFSALMFNFLPALLSKKEDLVDKSRTAINFLISIYTFVISTQYIYLFFDKVEFVITIYWGILSLLLLGYGISKDKIKLRTIGLYILCLTVLKILIFDIWSDLEDAIMRVVALMVVGVIMISISILYSKKYGGDLKGEFDFENLINS